MADFLLDTHVLLWWEDESRQLGNEARRAISDGANRIHVSAATVWEANLKARKGKLRLRGSLVTAIASNGFAELPVTALDAERSGALEWSHGDPFDRLLVAQAIGHALVLITSDAAIARFRGIAQLWAGT